MCVSAVKRIGFLRVSRSTLLLCHSSRPEEGNESFLSVCVVKLTVCVSRLLQYAPLNYNQRIPPSSPWEYFSITTLLHPAFSLIPHTGLWAWLGPHCGPYGKPGGPIFKVKRGVFFRKATAAVEACLTGDSALFVGGGGQWRSICVGVKLRWVHIIFTLHTSRFSRHYQSKSTE